MTRDEILLLSEEQLSQIVEFDFFKRSGNGGQKRNKTSSAVRVRLKEFDISAEDCTERSQKLNRSKALQKLRHKIAMTVRQEPTEEILAAVSPSNNRYPLFLAHLLDLLASVNYSFKECGLNLNLSSSQIEKLLRKDPALWQFVQSRKQNESL
jgi:hypothetical protein